MLTSNFGVFSLYGGGSNVPAAFHANGVSTGLFNPGRTGETLVLWGTGLGAISGDDASGAAGGDLGTPLQVFVGGVPATTVYRGRSPGSTGLDQINFIVPAGAYGCDVSLVVQTGTIVSNWMILPVSPDGSPCSEPLSVFNVPLGGPKNTYRVGSLVLSDAFNAGAETSTISAAFRQISPPPIPQAFNSPGSCVVSHGPENQVASGFARLLDAGSSLTLTSSGAQLAVPKSSPGAYTGTLPSRPAGSYILSNGGGGADVGAFSVGFTAPVQPFTWSNPAGRRSTDRSDPTPHISMDRRRC